MSDHMGPVCFSAYRIADLFKVYFEKHKTFVGNALASHRLLCIDYIVE